MRIVFTTILLVLFLLPLIDDSSTAMGQTYIDSMVTSHINTRRREYVYKSRSHWHKKKAKQRKQRKPVHRPRHRS